MRELDLSEFSTNPMFRLISDERIQQLVARRKRDGATPGSFTKGNVPWNKDMKGQGAGKIVSKETRKRMSETQLKKAPKYMTPKGVMTAQEASVAFGVSKVVIGRRLNSDNYPDYYKILVK